jgi:hypothetical protein
MKDASKRVEIFLRNKTGICNNNTYITITTVFSKKLLHATGRCRHQIAEEEFISKLFW